MFGTNLRHSRSTGSSDVVHPVALQQHTRAAVSDDGWVAHVVVGEARKHCALDASMHGPSVRACSVLFHGHTKACAPSSSLMRSR
jgi:hypothetical protein